MNTAFVDRMEQLARTQGDQIAVAFKKETLTYAQLRDKMVAIGVRLREMGIRRGGVVLFSATSKPEAVATYLGVLYAGAVAVFVDKNATADNAFFMYQDTNAELFLTDKPMRGYEEKCHILSLRAFYGESVRTEEMAYAYRAPDGEAISEMIYTSGTTGRPKGVMLSYRAIMQILLNTIEGTGMRPDERILLPLPLNHSFALRVLRAGLYQGATIVLQNGFTFAREIENNQAAYGCTAIAIVPASVETIAKQMQDQFAAVMGKFRYIEVSAGSLSVEQRKRLTRLLPNTRIYNTWGSSESGGALFLDVTEAVKDPRRVSALGKPLACVQVRTLDEQGNEFVSDREHPGRMSLKGDMQMSGYWNRPELTEEMLRDGWLSTGDMVYIEDGYVYMLGRADDIINVGGEKVSPIEVENVAGEYPHIAECACIGVEDPQKVLGSVPVLFVVPRGQYAEEELARFLSARMERYKIPAHYVELMELPRNRMQKVDRKALRLLWENRGGETMLNETIKTILTRRSIRRFTEKPVDRALLEMIIKAGYYAPSGHNMQTWRFTVVSQPREIARLRQATVQAARENGVYCYGFENPAAVVLVSNDRRNPDGGQDACCAAQNMMLAAWSYGIGSVWLNALRNLRDAEPVKSLLDGYGIPESHIVWSMVGMGYPVTEGTLLKKRTDVMHWVDETTNEKTE